MGRVESGLQKRTLGRKWWFHGLHEKLQRVAMKIMDGRYFTIFTRAVEWLVRWLGGEQEASSLS